MDVTTTNIQKPLFITRRLRFLVGAITTVKLSEAEIIQPFRTPTDGTYPSIFLIIKIGELTYQLLLLGKSVEPFNPSFVLYEGFIPENFPVTSEFKWYAYLPWWTTHHPMQQQGHYYINGNVAKFLFDHEIKEYGIFYDSEGPICGNIWDTRVYCCCSAQLIP